MVEQIDGGNPAKIRARAEGIAARVREHQLSPLAIGYSVVALSLQESANYMRQAADLRISVAQMYELAERLDGLANDAALIGDANTGGRL